MSKQSGCKAILLLLCVLLLTGCAASPPGTVVRKDPADQYLISADTQGLDPDHRRVTLYFRWNATDCLAPESRIMDVPRNESAEKALVQALIDGPSAGGAGLTGLFPPGTEVLAVTVQGDTLFVTFNEALLGRYGDEPGDVSGEPWRTESPLRRRLCMDALTASLTEAGYCAQVQVLVLRPSAQGTSMRLPESFFTRNGEDDGLLPPFTRREDAILTPHRTAALILDSWITQDYETLYDLVAREGLTARPGEQAALDGFAAARSLTGYEGLTAGSVSYDGQRATLTVDLRFRGQDGDGERAGWPLRLIREGGLWKMDYEQLMAMMNGY
ncbi:MAG: GerMN domain-containing protein [Clostridia bacterium]|nr:GerMN domain-containing protein [Clostridia bacterium]